MKIKCIENKVSAVPKSFLTDYPVSYERFSVVIGKEYTVYALGEIEGNVWYCICDESYFLYPMWNPYPLFEISDNRLSRYWVFSFDEDNKKKAPFLSFPEWAKDSHYFYTQLVEGNNRDQNAVIFKSYKLLMDIEFPDSKISEKAQPADNEWLICPFCINAWQCSNNQDGMVICPKCNKIMHNPRYQASSRILN
jgi:hypothetical protein